MISDRSQEGGAVKPKALKSEQNQCVGTATKIFKGGDQVSGRGDIGGIQKTLNRGDFFG